MELPPSFMIINRAIDSKYQCNRISWQWKYISPKKRIQLVCEVGRKTYVFLSRFGSLCSNHPSVRNWNFTGAKYFHFCFLYNKTGANSSEWFEPAEDEAYKRTIALFRKKSKAKVKSSKTTSASTGGGYGGTGSWAGGGTGGWSRGKTGGGGRGKTGGLSTGGTGGGSRGGYGHGSSGGAGASGSGGRGSRCRSLPNDPGYIYIIQMSGEHQRRNRAPPFAKVGFTNNCQQRLNNLQAGNPYQLTCYQTYPVCNKHEAERVAHEAIRADRVRMGGGTEWFYYESLEDLEETVSAAIHQLIDRSVSDLVELSKNPCLTPNPAGVIMATNYGHLNPWFAGVYNQRWRQEMQGNVLQIKYNCK